MDSQVSIIIVSWNKKEFVLDCLKSLETQTFKDFETILVDNGSTDGLSEAVEKEYSKVKIVRLKENLGFVGGNNEGYKHSKGKYIVLLNNDTIVDKDWLKELVKMMNSDSKIGACQSKILDMKDHSSFEFTGAAGGLMDIYGYGFCRGRVFDEVEKDNGQYGDIINIFWTAGVSMITRRDIIEKIGLFDEYYFIYCEEVDFCWRLNLAGYELKYVPTSIVCHYGGASSQRGKVKINFKMAYLLHRNHMITLLKNYSIKSWFRIIPIKIILEFMAIGGFLFSNPARSIGILKSFWWVLTHPRLILKKHNEVQKLRKVSDKEIMKKMSKKSTAIGYWIFGKKKWSDYF